VRIGELLVTVITLYEGLILLRVIVSWFAPDSSHAAIELLKRLTDPLLEPVQKALPATGSIDLSPLVVLIGLELLKRFLT
jgi:YggT family protein